LRAKIYFKGILVFLAFLFLSGCAGEGGNIFNEILAKTVKVFSPKKEDTFTGKAELLNLVTSAEEEDEEADAEGDSIMLDSLQDVGEALNWVKAFYTDRDKRDPFTPLLTSTPDEEARVNVDLAELSGIIWVKDKYLAIVKEGNRGFVLKDGDPVVGGKVQRITESSVTFLLRKFGEQTKITLSLKKQER
jgi:hypothetical protein